MLLVSISNERYLPEFERTYDRRYAKRYGHWRPIIGEVGRRFLRCGDLHIGFARVRCLDCRHEMVAFSCQQRCLCPSCHQKRNLLGLTVARPSTGDPDTHEPLIEQQLWQRVQTLLGQKVYKQHPMTYASDLIECGHCGSPITGERKFKMTKSGEREYVYYRCTQYHKGDHPRIRLTENKLDQQMLSIFDTVRVEDDDFRDLFREQLRQATNWDQDGAISKVAQLQEELTDVRQQQKQLLNLRMLEEIDADTFASTSRESV